MADHRGIVLDLVITGFRGAAVTSEVLLKDETVSIALHGPILLRSIQVLGTGARSLLRVVQLVGAPGLLLQHVADIFKSLFKHISLLFMNGCGPSGLRLAYPHTYGSP